MSKKELEETDLTPYRQKIKEYMGEEVFEKLKGGLSVQSYYIDKKGKVIPISVFTWIRDVVTEYGLFGDEGAGFRFSRNYLVDAANYKHFYYLIDGKFIKGERTEGKRW